MSSGPSKDPNRIRDMFDSVAGQYDFLNRLLSLGLDRFWRRQLVGCIPNSPVLDLACGSGDVLCQLGEDGLEEKLTGVDFSRGMLDHARQKLSDRTVSAQLVQGDALALPLGTSVYSGATCAFGVRNFDDRPRAFEEVNRVLTDPGRFAILEFFPPSDTVLNKPIRWYLGTLLPAIGGFFSDADDAYDYLNRSINNFISARTLKKELLSAGFDDASEHSVFFGLVKIITAGKDVSD